MWSLSSPVEDSGFVTEMRAGYIDADAVAVRISISADVEKAVAASRKNLPQFRADIHVRKDPPFPHRIDNPGQAVDIAHTRQFISHSSTDYLTNFQITMFAGLLYCFPQLFINRMNPKGRPIRPSRSIEFVLDGWFHLCRGSGLFSCGASGDLLLCSFLCDVFLLPKE